jgi:para-nitrobenzyl esterase
MAKSPGTIVETKNGRVQGIKQGGLYVFKGIPYAAPPTGKRRWLAPQPVEGWSEIRHAKSFGPA